MYRLPNPLIPHPQTSWIFSNEYGCMSRAVTSICVSKPIRSIDKGRYDSMHRDITVPHPSSSPPRPSQANSAHTLHKDSARSIPNHSASIPLRIVRDMH